MIEEVLKRNNINLTKRVIERIKKATDAEEVSNTINYLMCQLNISASAIENYPDILRNNWESIRNNYEKLKEWKVEKLDHDTLLPILAVPKEQLEEIYFYALSEYGRQAILDCPFILSVSEKRLQEVEQVVEGYPTDTVFLVASSKHNPEEIENILKMCQGQGLEITRVLLNRTAREIEGIQDFCSKYHLPLKESFFYKHPNELDNTAGCIKDEYGEEYVTPSIVVYDRGHLQRMFAYIRAKKCLELVQKDPSILRLSLDELIDREIVIREKGESFTVQNEEGEEVFHPILNMSRKEYLEIKKQVLGKKGSQK